MCVNFSTQPNIKNDIRQIGENAKAAALALAGISTTAKNDALIAGAKALRDNSGKILKANALDIASAKENGISGALLDRLELDESRIEAIAKGLGDIAKLDDPVGRELARWSRPNGLDIARVTVPLGVIGIIYESRPNVTADAGALCLKSGNAVILRGGSESFHSSSAIVDCLKTGLLEAGLPEHAIQLIPTKDRSAVGEMLKAAEYIDVIIPRGGKSLIKRIIKESKIPTLQHLDGNCHTYIDKGANLEKTVNVVRNAKMRRIGICGATESLVIHKEIADTAIPAIVDALTKENCEICGDETAVNIDNRITQATSDDWDTEYLAAKISVKVVDNLEEAIAFVNSHSSHHTDAIITEDTETAELFLNRIDSAIVMHNTSTQFADGGEFGMGAEIGIATGKLHARGPVGLEQLTIFKYIVRGDGQVRG